MARVLVNEENLTNIANAIREKNGETTTYKPSEMDEAISNIKTGDTTVEDGLITSTLSGDYSNDRIKTIKTHCFLRCKNLNNVNFPLVTEIGTYAFSECTKLKSANVPSVTSMGMKAFEYCDLLATIDMPLLTKTPERSFQNCKNLTSANLPLVTELGAYTFYTCSKLENINIPSVTKLISPCFGLCISLKKIDLNTVSSIGANEFYGCSILETIILRSPVLCTLTNVAAFTNSSVASGTCYIYVPSTLIEEYKAATNWSTFANQFRAIEDYPDICGEVNG